MGRVCLPEEGDSTEVEAEEVVVGGLAGMIKRKSRAKEYFREAAEKEVKEERKKKIRVKALSRRRGGDV
jgi:hypothetical protein